MLISTSIVLTVLLGISQAGPIPLHTRQSASPCFVTGTVALPAEVSTIANDLADSITCSADSTTLSGVPDVTSNGISFSSIDFSDSALSPLAFALSTFATPTPLASADLPLFQDRLDVYLATEAGVRSVGGGLAIKVPKFFLAFQVARIKTAQGLVIDDPGQTVEHLLGKVVKNAGGEDAGLIAQVETLATVLA